LRAASFAYTTLFRSTAWVLLSLLRRWPWRAPFLVLIRRSSLRRPSQRSSTSPAPRQHHTIQLLSVRLVADHLGLPRSIKPEERLDRKSTRLNSSHVK